jgi:drug/metabolite transporter (DMT)-like permease
MLQWLWGAALVGISATAFGAMAIFAHYAAVSGADPITVLFLRFAIAAICLLIFTLTQKLPFPQGKNLWSLIVMGAIGFVSQSICFFTALTLIPASLVALLLYLYPAIVALFAIAFLHEPITKPKAIALGLALAGMVLTVGAAGSQNGWGILLGLTSALIYACYLTVGGKIMQQESAIPACTVIMSSAAIMLGLLVAVRGANLPATATGWWAIVAIALVCTVLAVVTLFAGMKRIGATNAATLSTLEPVVTVILAALLLEETITPTRMIGGLLILIAVLVLTKGEIQPKGNVNYSQLPTSTNGLQK